MSGKRKEIKYIISQDGCHECISHHINIHGYPCLWKNGRQHNMHRIIFEEKYGKISDGYLVRHICDNRKCININHLIVGTRADNTHDITNRNRHNPPHGIRSGTAKLNDELIRMIRNSNISHAELANQLDVHQTTITRIKNNKRWKHIK